MPRIGEQSPFDHWLRRGLTESYCAVLREKLPEELERLVMSLPEQKQPA